MRRNKIIYYIDVSLITLKNNKGSFFGLNSAYFIIFVVSRIIFLLLLGMILWFNDGMQQVYFQHNYFFCITSSWYDDYIACWIKSLALKKDISLFVVCISTAHFSSRKSACSLTYKLQWRCSHWKTKWFWWADDIGLILLPMDHE